MPVKYWSFAGLILTAWCNATCDSCYLCCSPARRETMSVDQALIYWRSLAEACPHGCRIHLTGGEPFGDWPKLIEICRRAQTEGLGPLDAVETNAFWADDEALVRRRIEALDAAGMRKLTISADPHHQQFVPIRNCRLAARIAEEVLGPDRVQVRWRDWLAEGQDTAALSDSHRAELLRRYASGGRERLTGRAARRLAGMVSCKATDEFADNPCREALLRSRHVHVGPGGEVLPGTCAGIVLGTLADVGASELWRRLDEDHAARPVVGTLARQGPAGLLADAAGRGFAPKGAYAGKCHLCWDTRRWLAEQGLYPEELAPMWMYGP